MGRQVGREEMERLRRAHDEFKVAWGELVSEARV